MCIVPKNIPYEAEGREANSPQQKLVGAQSPNLAEFELHNI